MKLLYLPLFSILFLFAAPLTYADPVDNVAELIRQGNTREITKLFAKSIEIAIMGDENTMPDMQAGEMLGKFFATNTPMRVKMLHKINSNPNYLFAVLFLTTDKGVYRVTFTMNKKNTAMKIIEFRVEAEKTK